MQLEAIERAASASVLRVRSERALMTGLGAFDLGADDGGNFFPDGYSLFLIGAAELTALGSFESAPESTALA